MTADMMGSGSAPGGSYLPGAVHGAPGVRVVPVDTGNPPWGVHLDLAAFAGVAPRGPVRLPQRPLEPDEDVGSYLAGVPAQRSTAVTVQTWTAYRRLFGGFEGAGRLPYAVSAFFAQGGRRARIVRIVHDYRSPADGHGRAVGFLARREPAGGLSMLPTTALAPVCVLARSEGSWGDRIHATLSFTARPLVEHGAHRGGFETATTEWVPIGSLIRATAASGEQSLRYVTDSSVQSWPDRPGTRRMVTLAVPLSAEPAAIEVVTASLTVLDEDPGCPRSERLDGIGLSAEHPRWLARVLIQDSALLWPHPSWANATLALADAALPDLVLASPDAAAGSDPTPEDMIAGLLAHPDGLRRERLAGGRDRSAEITPADFFDQDWVAGDERPGAGVQVLAEAEDIGLLVVPDLYDPAPLPPPADITDPAVFAGPDFAPCLTVPASTQADRPAALAGLRLDPGLPAELEQIGALQRRLVDFAESCRRFTVLLDVPPGLERAKIIRWRASFDSAYAAAYHPWLDVATPDDSRDALIRLNPAAFAAGVIAARELAHGISFGPANVVVGQAVRTAAQPERADHHELHDDGVNVFQRGRDGISLSGARTLSRDRRLRQLSVARLLTSIRLTLLRETAWAVFEPAGPALFATLRRAISDYLDALHAAGSLAGTTASDAYFVLCDETTTTAADRDAGRIIALVGVAPAEPVEYITLRLAVGAEPTARLEVSHG